MGFVGVQLSGFLHLYLFLVPFHHKYLILKAEIKYTIMACLRTFITALFVRAQTTDSTNAHKQH